MENQEVFKEEVAPGQQVGGGMGATGKDQGTRGDPEIEKRALSY